MRRFVPYFRFLRPVRVPFIAALLLGALNGVASGFGLPFASQKVFPRLFGDTPPSTTTLLIAVSILPAAFLVRGLAGYFNAYLMTFCGMRVLRSLQLLVFRKVQALPLQFFHTMQTGDLMARITGDTATLNSVLTSTANDLIKQPLTFLSALGALVYFAYMDRELVFVLFCLGVIPLLVIPVRFTGRKLADKAKLLQRQAGSVNSLVQENLQAKTEVRLFNLQEQQNARFETELTSLQRFQLKVVKYERLLSPTVELLSAVGLGAAVFYSARRGVTIDSVIPLIFALAMSYQPLKSFGTIHNQFKRGLASLDRIEEILYHDNPIKEPAEPVPSPTARGDVEFRGVSFGYDDRTLVLRDINERVPAGRIVALVGPSGAGKTTFANLIPRLYEATTGQVLVDGVDVREYRKLDLRGKISIVSQDPVLFNDTIRNNILVGRRDATEHAVVEAGRQAFADEFIGNLEAGYDTVVGERGVRLSGGQKQRIAIARAFLKDAPILVLDEATSNLDSESEAMIQQALARLVEGRTTFIIAHRFSTLRIADRLLFFEDGRITASGSSVELRETSERFRRLFDLQTDLRWTEKV